MEKEKCLWWTSVFLSVILYARAADVLKNKNVNRASNVSSFWLRKGKCKEGVLYPLTVDIFTEFFCATICKYNTGLPSPCGQGLLCISHSSMRICVPKCDTDDDCEYPTKCHHHFGEGDEKFCFWETCHKEEDCQNSLICKKSFLSIQRKICLRRRCFRNMGTECDDGQICDPNARACQCANGMSGSKCEVAEWCKDSGKFKDCKGVNGTCQYIKERRTVDCICTNGKQLHPGENRCRETCDSGIDCKNGGVCEEKGGYKFCNCKLGLYGDKCETVLDCTPKGKYKDCENSGGKCSYDGSRAICECPQNQKLNDKEFICEDCICKGGECVVKGGKKVCKCPPGYGNFTSISCKACDCGPDTDCIWEGGFGGGKICLCKPGYSTKKGKCVACECGPDSNCEWISERWLEPEKKVCYCKPGYHEENGKCVDKHDL